MYLGRTPRIAAISNIISFYSINTTLPVISRFLDTVSRSVSEWDSLLETVSSKKKASMKKARPATNISVYVAHG